MSIDKFPTGPLGDPMRMLLTRYFNSYLEYEYVRCLQIDNREMLFAKAAFYQVELANLTSGLSQVAGDYPGFIEKVVCGEILESIRALLSSVRKQNRSSVTLLFNPWLESMESLKNSSTPSEVGIALFRLSDEGILLRKMQEELFQKAISNVPEADQEELLLSLLEPAKRELLQQTPTLGGVKERLADLHQHIRLAALIATFVAAWKVWIYRLGP